MPSSFNLEAGSYIVPAEIPSALVLDHLQQMLRHLPLIPEGVPDSIITAPTGECIIAPTVVRALGNGDLEAGHLLLDQFVRKGRREQVDKLKEPSYHDYILADVDPEDEAEDLRKTREEVKTKYGTPDHILDGMYGLRSRPKPK